MYTGLSRAIPDVTLNGPALDPPDWRLPGNLNVSIGCVDGEALLMSTRDVAASTGSACSSADPQPSHVLQNLGIGDDATRSSVRFGLGRFNTVEEVDFAVEALGKTASRLRRMSSHA